MAIHFMNRTTRLILFFVVFNFIQFTPIALADSTRGYSFKPKEGFVPDESTAIRIAEAVLIPIYGEDKIKNERPFKATLRKNTWVVEGSLPREMLGGVAVAEISKKDGRILRVSHGK